MAEDFDSIIYFVILLIVGYFIYNWYKNWKAKEVNKSVKSFEYLINKVNRIVAQNVHQLSVQRKKSVYIDSYGGENIANWYNTEIPYFVLNYIYPKLSDTEILYFEMEQDSFFQLIDAAAKSISTKTPFKENMTGVDFEQFCAQKLEEEGWIVHATKNTGDQGIDLIIEKEMMKVGVQCKKYAKPVGNKAVQEVIAGLSYYGLAYGVVLTNSTFTKSAIELANMNNIKLIHYLETESL